jgi:Dolichyl-phosphate-mannose-protein mannosyltransferase
VPQPPKAEATEMAVEFLSNPDDGLPRSTAAMPPWTSRLIWNLTAKASDVCLHYVDRFRRPLFAFIFFLYLAGFTGQWRMEPDSALFLSLGRNLSRGLGYSYLGHPHPLAYPGLPYLWAVMFKIFGDTSLLPQHIAMLLMTFATLAMVYRLFFLHCDRPTAVLMTIGVALTKTFFRYAYELRSDIPYMLGVMMFLAGYEAILTRPARSKRWYDWLFLIGGLFIAASTRPTMVALLLAVAGTVVWECIRRRMNWRSLAVLAGLLLAVVLIFHALDPRRAAANSTHLQYEEFVVQSVAANFGANISANVGEMLKIAVTDAMLQVRFGLFNIPISLLLIALAIGLVRRRVLWGLFVAANVLMLLVIQPMDRYFLPIMPLLAFGWWLFLRWTNDALPRRWGNLLFLVLLALGIGPNFCKVGGVILDQRQRTISGLGKAGLDVSIKLLPAPDSIWAQRGRLELHESETYVPTAAIAQEIRRDVEPDAIVLICHPLGRIVAYLSDRQVADSPSFAWLDLQNHPVYLLQPTDMPTTDLLQQNHLQSGPSIATVPNTSHPAWTLHRTQPLR